MESQSKEPATEPVHTKGNVFWRGNERFLIRGISYIPEDLLEDRKSNLDILAEDRLDDLKRDIRIFSELSLNTVRVTGLSPTNNHSKALEILREAGIYVLIELFEDIETPHPNDVTKGDFETAPFYSYHMLKRATQIVDEMVEHPNILGFIVCGDAITRPDTSKIAEVHRAAIADLKQFLRLRGGRDVPVGIGMVHHQLVKLYQAQYFTAGSPDERADFLALDCWSWADSSTFRVSGYKTLVENFSKYPLPMFFRAYGGYVQKPRIWQEVECLYSPEMTGVFSGGCLHTYFESGNNYGIVKIREDGTVARKPEFAALKKRFKRVDSLPRHALYLSEFKKNDTWRGEFPQPTPMRGYATSKIPRFSGSWDELVQSLEDEKDWVFIDAMERLDIADKA